MSVMLKKLIQWLPLVVIIAIMWKADHVMRYPAQIGVTVHSCSDLRYTSHITFRQRNFCVTPEEHDKWNRMWMELYALIMLFAVTTIVASFARRGSSGQPIS